MATMNNVLAVIMGGGRGTRLYPLTKMRSKPAVPIAGKYRLIDIPISNCINSGIYRVAVLTQFNSVSLHRHITETYKFDSFHTGWVQIWPPSRPCTDLVPGHSRCGPQAAVRDQGHRRGASVILAGDHLYRMDYAAMLDSHWKKGPISPWRSSRWAKARSRAWASSNARTMGVSWPLPKSRRTPRC